MIGANAMLVELIQVVLLGLNMCTGKWRGAFEGASVVRNQFLCERDSQASRLGSEGKSCSLHHWIIVPRTNMSGGHHIGYLFDEDQCRLRILRKTKSFCH